MEARDPERDPRALLGELLRLARQQSQYKTGEALAHAIGKERTGIVRGESGERIPDMATLGEWLTQCGVTGLAEAAIRGVWKLARNHGGDDDEPVKVWFSGYLAFEAVAHTIRTWHPVIVPGLLQTEDYARALFTAMGMGLDEVQAQIDLRARRQEILTRPHPPNLTIVLWEPVLDHQIGTAETMRAQLAKLLDLPGNVVVQVVPSDLGGNAGLGGAVTVAEGSDGVFLLAEALLEDQVTKDRDLVRLATATFDAVRADAVSRAQSRTLIMEAIERWNSR
jgi:hypothetical protein